jgi:hypothetical protein
MFARHVVVRSPRALFAEALERRSLLSAGGPPSGSVDVFNAHSNVEGKPISQWTAEIWQKVFSIPVFASDGTTVINPNFDAAPVHAVLSNDGKVMFLCGTFDSGNIMRSETVPTGTPLLLPMVTTEWSNPDTASKESGYTTYPGNYSAGELQQFATNQTMAVTELHASIDGRPVGNLFSHREIAPVFTYNLPPQHNIMQEFFHENISGPQSPAVADGYYLMLKPLSPGSHVIEFSGAMSDLSAMQPQLPGFTVHSTVTLNVVPKGKFDRSPAPAVGQSGMATTPFSSASIEPGRAIELIGAATDDAIF